ncbi:HNH endonuclease family protein [Actinokineospora inagensis]|uniref:HNH endonuclease family protein n=1 Tax=Actinokineospora inagensis TaxID=103730 RepID=UPI00042148E9|nr:HNH endonuclease family protein [Actinokineospora inagensis]
MRSAVPALTLLAAIAVAACDPNALGTTSSTVETPAAPGNHAAQLAALGQPRPEDTGAHYNRAEWGDWKNQPGTKCSTREQVLVRDGDGETVDAQCKPTCPKATCWTSRYDGVTSKDAADLQIDHIVPLAEAARSGARDWTAAQRSAYYNDTTNLIAVTARSNTQKSDGDPAKWRPTRTYWCDYATAYVAVKVKYKLSVDDAELAALTQMLNTCP